MSSSEDVIAPISKGKSNKSKRSDKGKSLLVYTDSYTVIDIETTGLSKEENEIIELTALKVRSRKIVSEFTRLIKPSVPIPWFISSLTGITNEMVEDAPIITDVLPEFLDYVGNDIILGHNVNFDVNFIYDISKKFFGRPFANDMIDTLRLSRILMPDMEHHKLAIVAKELGIKFDTVHRSSADTETTYKVYEKLKELYPDFATERGPNKVITKTKKDNKKNRIVKRAEYVIIGELEKINNTTAEEAIKEMGGLYSISLT